MDTLIETEPATLKKGSCSKTWLPLTTIWIREKRKNPNVSMLNLRRELGPERLRKVNVNNN